MNKIAAYEIALENIELEKRADYLVDAYGTCEGYMPDAYLQAFDQLEKEAAILDAVANLGKGLIRSGSNIATKGGGKATASNIATKSGIKFKPGAEATFGQQMRVHGGNLAQGAGRFMAARPGAALAVGGLGTAGAAGLGYKALK
jgi:hypothetical protein